MLGGVTTGASASATGAGAGAGAGTGAGAGAGVGAGAGAGAGAALEPLEVVAGDWPPIDDGSGGEGRCSDAAFVGSDGGVGGQGRRVLDTASSLWERRIEFHMLEVGLLTID